MTDVIDQLAAQRILPILRSVTVKDAVSTARACARAGATVVELTHTTPDVELAVRELQADGITAGVGTITAGRQVEAAAAAGARFVVSFCNPAGFVDTARSCGLLALPGALTPTEIHACIAVGAEAVKIFPASLAAPRYLRDLVTVLPATRIVPTGGIASSEVRAWLDAGAVAVGLGGDLGTAEQHGADEVQRRVAAAFAFADAHERPTNRSTR